MILADTSVWVKHFRRGEPDLAQALMEGRVLMHPFVLGEIACGSLQHRSRVLSDLQQLPQAVSAEHNEVLDFLERHRLYSKGMGWIDAHLLASAALTRCNLWTHDARLSDAASALRLSIQSS